MFRSAVGKVMWVGRATVFLVGLAVILALVFGVASTAMGSNGQAFLLGKKNLANGISTLVKQGPGPALSLVVRADQPPLVVNASAGKAANLDSDKLDGVDSTGFLRSDGKAADADKLDGLDSGQLMRETAYAERTQSVSDSSRHKVVDAPCSPRHVAIGGSARIAVTRGPGTGSEVPVALTVSEEAGEGWRAEAQEMVPYEGDWYLLVHPICVPKEPEIGVGGVAVQAEGS